MIMIGYNGTFRCEHLRIRAIAFTLGVFTSQRYFHNVKDVKDIIYTIHYANTRL